MKKHYLIGVDIGQSQDHTAIVIAEKIDESLNVGEIIRIELGTSYPKQVEMIKQVVESIEEQNATKKLLIDATGVGTSVCDLLESLWPVKVIIHGGHEERKEGNSKYYVPKKDLVSSAQLALQNGELKIHPKLPLAVILRKELEAFRAFTNARGHESYANNPRENPHDDLVLATALICWWSKKGSVNEPVAGSLGIVVTGGNKPSVDVDGVFCMLERDFYGR